MMVPADPTATRHAVDMDTLSEARQAILSFIKERGGGTTAEIADALATSYEGARQQLVQLERDGLIARSLRRTPDSGAGRPASEYRLTARGEDLFPKAYDALAVEMLDVVAHELGTEALRAVLEAMTQDRVDRWAAQLEGLSLEQKLDALSDLYRPNDEHTEVLSGGEFPEIVERNCPFLNVASRRPALCSVTVSTLQRLVGYRVERVKKFQQGHGRCVFRIRTDQPLPPQERRFEFEKDVGDG